MGWIVLISVVLIILGFEGYRLYSRIKLKKNVKIFRLDEKILFHLERALSYYPVLVSQFEQEQETGDEPRFGSIYLNWAEHFNRRYITHTKYLKEHPGYITQVIESKLVEDIEFDIEGLKNVIKDMNVPLTISLNLVNTIINIEGEVSESYVNSLNKYWLKKKNILLFFN